jgi:hypothetical protein
VHFLPGKFCQCQLSFNAVLASFQPKGELEISKKIQTMEGFFFTKDASRIKRKVREAWDDKIFGVID